MSWFVLDKKPQYRVSSLSSYTKVSPENQRFIQISIAADIQFMNIAENFPGKISFFSAVMGRCGFCFAKCTLCNQKRGCIV